MLDITATMNIKHMSLAINSTNLTTTPMRMEPVCAKNFELLATLKTGYAMQQLERFGWTKKSILVCFRPLEAKHIDKTVNAH